VHAAVGPPGESAMNTWRWGIAAGVVASAMVLGLASCGDDDNNTTTSTTPPQVDADPLRLEIQAATVPDFATTARPTVTFRVLDGSNNPIDLEAELATTTTFPRVSTAPSFTIAMLNDLDDYVSYYSTTRAPDPKGYTYLPDPEVVGSAVADAPDGGEAAVKAANAPATRTQATASNSSRTTITRVGERTYQFTFPAAGYSTAGMDRTKTHTVAGRLVRLPNGADQDIGFGSFNFVPAGGTARKLETITDEGCNRCHGALTAHGTRRGVQFCITCHSPQTGDPDTNRSVDFKQMIHKIHYGSGLPSVRQGGADAPYYIVGNSQNVHDWSDLSFPWHEHGVQHCTVCHTGANADNWKTKPSLNVCSSCHDNVKFTATAGLDPCPVGTAAVGKFADCLHAGGLFPTANPSDPTACQGCHGPGTIASVDKFHHGD
jgi:OmcA/MtrC family decaheme c-type cytochrome